MAAPRQPKRTIELTREEVDFVRRSLDRAVQAVRDSHYDPQVEAWAIEHRGENEARIREAEATANAIRKALSEGS